MSLARRFLAGSGLSLIDQALKMASAFVLTPIIVAGLGAGPYGAWCVLMAVFAQYGWLDLGLGVSIPRFFAKAIGRKDDQEVKVLAGTGAVVFLVIASASILLSLAVAWQSPSWFQGSGVEGAMPAVVLMCGTFIAAQTLTQLSLGYLKGHLRYDRIAAASIVRVILTAGLIVLALRRGWGLTGVAAMHTVCILIECAMLVTFARRQQPPLRPAFADFQKPKAVELFKYSATAYLLMAGQSLRNSLDPIIISMQAGEEAVTGYALGNRFPVLFVDIAHILAGGQLLSLFSHFIGNNDQAGLNRAFLFSSRMCATIAVLGSGLMWMFGEPFFQRWIPEHALAAWQVLIPAVLPKALFIAQTPSMVLLLAQAKHRRLAEIDWMSGACNLGLTWWLAGRMGAPGAAWATCVEQSLVCGLVWPFLGARAAEMPFWKVWGNLLLIPVLKAALVLLPCALLIPFARPDYLWLTGIGSLCCLWFFAGNALLLSAEERQWAVRTLPFLKRFARKEDADAPPGNPG